jgi:hypothetical protein
MSEKDVAAKPNELGLSTEELLERIKVQYAKFISQHKDEFEAVESSIMDEEDKSVSMDSEDREEFEKDSRPLNRYDTRLFNLLK